MVIQKLLGLDLPTTSDLWSPAGGGDEWQCLVPGADIRVITSGGRAIDAHSSVLASASPVLERRLFKRPPKRHHNGATLLPIAGVPCDAVLAFLRCLYRGKMASLPPKDCDGGETTSRNNHAVHLLVLSHAMRVPWLKRAAESALASSLRADDVADLLQLAKRFDAPRLKVRCLNYVRDNMAAVEATEGWRFLRRCNPRMEADAVRFVKEAQKRDERRHRRREENRAYVELGDAVECLHHILREGCGGVGPRERRGPAAVGKQDHLEADGGCCWWGQTCEGLRALIRHFATCHQRRGGSGGCSRCGRMVQLLRLHATISCELDNPVPPPLSAVCALKPGEEDDSNVKWQLLARKVVSTKLMTSLALSKRKRENADEGSCRRANTKPWKNHRSAA